MHKSIRAQLIIACIIPLVQPESSSLLFLHSFTSQLDFNTNTYRFSIFFEQNTFLQPKAQPLSSSSFFSLSFHQLTPVMSPPQSHPQSPEPVPGTPTRRIFAQPAPLLKDNQDISSPRIAINMRRFRKTARPKSGGHDDDLDELNSPAPATGADPGTATVKTRLIQFADVAPQNPSLQCGNVLSPAPSTPLSAVKRRRTERASSDQHPLAAILAEAIKESPLRKAARSNNVTLPSIFTIVKTQPISVKSPYAEIDSAKVRHSTP
jgi:hypothetical protein